MDKPILILLQSTDSPVIEHLTKGIWGRQSFTLNQYAKHFNVYYYTSDRVSYQGIMPAGVLHVTGRLQSARFGIRHILYYCSLIIHSFKWRFLRNSVIRVVGVNVPIIPIIRFVSGKKVVVSYQFDWAYGMKKDYKGIKPLVSTFVQSWVINSADYLICTTNWLKEIAVQRYRFDANKIRIIPNYVNIDLFKPDASKKKQIVFAGRMHWSKGVDILIRAFDSFSKNIDSYTLILLGSGEEEESLKELTHNSNVIFKGSVSNLEVAKYLNESEIFVLPTVNMEGHPKALVEAMASGCKCITSNVPGNNNVLQESQSSEFLFETRNSDDLCKKMMLAVNSTSSNQYEYAKSNYSSGVCFGNELNLLKSLR